jgi:hypothetical protein
VGAIDFGIPRSFATLLKSKLGLANFVETGTFKGDTAAWAAAEFARVWTIEADPALAQAARTRFADRPGVTVIAGDSASALEALVPTLPGPALFWLDAHWCGTDPTETAGATDQCPLLKELAAIARSPYEHAILVDDARYFLAPPPSPNRPEQWPDAAATLAALIDGRADRYAGVVDDVFFRAPAILKGDIQAHIDRLTAHREARARKRENRPLRRLKRFLKELGGARS